MPKPTHGQLIDHAVFAERLARRTEAGGRFARDSVSESSAILASLESKVDQLQRQLEIANRGQRSEELQLALAASNGEAAQLRARMFEWRLQMRITEIKRSSEAVRLSVLEHERASDQGIARAARVALAQQARVLEGEREKIQQQAAALAAVRSRIGLLQAAQKNEAVRHREILALERSAHQRTSERLVQAFHDVAELRQELSSSGQDKVNIQRELQAARGRVNDLERQLGRAKAELELVRRELASATQRLTVDDLARIVMEQELAKAQEGSRTLSLELAAERREREQYVAILERRDGELEAARGELRVAEEKIETAKAGAFEQNIRLAKTQAQLRLETESGEQVVADLAQARERICELEDLSRIEVAAADPSVVSAPESDEGLGSAQDALVERMPQPGSEPAEIPGPQSRPRISPSVETWAPVPSLAQESRKLEQIVADLDAAATALRQSTALVSPVDETVVEVLDSPEVRQRNELPQGWLARSLAQLAQVNPYTAAQLLVQLLPVQAHALRRKLVDYDLTITELGTFAISLRNGEVHSKRVQRARPRARVAFHIKADSDTLTGLIAGEDRKIARFGRGAKIHGSRRIFGETLAAITSTPTTWGDLVRTGIQLSPRLVLPLAPFAIDPEWTRGHSFTVGIQLTGADGQPVDQWNVQVRDGQPLLVKLTPCDTAADGVVKLSSTAFQLFLSGGVSPHNERPSIKGDKLAVETLKTWIDRALNREENHQQDVRTNP